MMSRNSVLFITSLLLLVLSVSLSAASAFPSNVNNSMAGNLPQSYGADIVIIQHLIEIDQVSNPGYFKIEETIVYKNIGTENYTGPIYTWVPDGAFNVYVAKLEMAMGGQVIQIPGYMADVNLVGWDDTILSGSYIAPMYQVGYVVPAEPAGTITESATFTKKLKYPTLINYDYLPTIGPALVVKLVKSDELKATMMDGEGRKIVPDPLEIEEDPDTYNWIQPQFAEISIKFSQSTITSSEIALYLFLILVIAAVIGYPFIRKKSSAIRDFEEKFGRIIPKKQDEDIYWEKEEDEYEEGDIEEEEYEEEESSLEHILDKGAVEAFDLDELNRAKRAVLKVLLELDKDYADGAVSEDEYQRIRNDYKEKAINIMKQLDILGEEE